MNVYGNPLFYEIAFDFVDAEKQVDFFEKIAAKHSEIKPQTFLDIACGPSPQLLEIARRGYRGIGLDSSSAMLRFLGAKAKRNATEVRTVKADMRNFCIRPKADLAFCMLGSIAYTGTRSGLNKHLHSVAKSIRRGGLYVIENIRIDKNSLLKGEKWTMQRGKLKTRVGFGVSPVSPGSDMFVDNITIVAIDGGHRRTLTDKCKTQFIPKGEIESIVERSSEFEIVGWFEHFRLKPLRELTNRNLFVLKRL